jgi:hypothetical protein
MKMIPNKANPAFKRTQPLPMLSAEFAQRAGRAAMSFARAMPLAGAWATAGLSGARPAVSARPGYNTPAVGFMS